MNGKELLQGMNYVDEKFVDEALRDQYPIYGVKAPELAAMPWYSFEDIVEMSETFIYGEITGDSTAYLNDSVECYEYPVSVIEDTEGLFTGGEQISINHTEIMKDYYGVLSEGMKIVVPVIKDDDGSNRYNYSVIGMYYVTEDGYVISAYDEEERADQVYSGMNVKKFLEEIKNLK